MRITRWITCFCFALQLQACAYAPPSDTLSLSIPFLTTRGVYVEASGEVRYTTDTARLSGGQCQVGLQTQEKLDATNGPVIQLSNEAVIDSLTGMASEGILVYVHGYNTDLERGCRDAAMLAYRTGFEGRVLLLSWPASGMGVTYWKDERRLAQSMPEMLAVLDGLGARFGDAKINIVAHSMGSRLVLSEVPPSDDVRRFKNLILVAADIDTEVFLAALPFWKQRVENIAVLVSPADKLLMLSQTVNLGQRLGQVEALGAEGVDIVDVSEFEDLGFSGHVYHLDSAQVGDVLKAILAPPVSD